MTEKDEQQGQSKSQVFLALTIGHDAPALGNVWRITSKKSDFYLDTFGPTQDAMHMSLHGPKKDHSGHRFHLKIKREAVEAARSAGQFVEHGLPRNGQQFQGREIADGVYHVVRLRWRWHLQRDKYRAAAATPGPLEFTEGQSGRVMREVLNPNSAWDVDFFLAYDRPYWPLELGRRTGDPRIGPIVNDSGLHLTLTSTHRSEKMNPAPEDLLPRLPKGDETPNRLMAGGFGPDGEAGIYWFVETITAREFLVP